MGTIYIGRYKVIEELGRGGMGVVYRGEDPVLERPVAIKVLPPKKMNAKSIERFLREAKTSARLDNPYIVKIHDIGQVDDIRFIVMEYVEGSALGDMIEYEEIPTPEQTITRLKIFRQVLEAVKYAHEAGVIHRDLKPDNIMINKAGNVKIMDFGLAFFAGQHSLTEVGQVMGTAAYVSPEQAAGKITDERTDIYSLGVILFELLTGRWPFEAQNPLEMFRKVAEMPAPSPKVFNKNVSLGLEALVLRALRKKPEDRFRNVGEMLESFDLCLRQGTKEANSNSSSSGSFAAVDSSKLSTKAPVRLPAPSSARSAVPSGSKTPERLPDPGALKRSNSASASSQISGPVSSPVSVPDNNVESSSSREELDKTQVAGAAPPRYAPSRQTFTSGRSAVVGSSRRSNVRKGGGGVITIGGEAAFRTSVASYQSDRDSVLLAEQSEPVRVVVPPPGPAMKKAIEQTSVDVKIPEANENKEAAAERTAEQAKTIKPEVNTTPSPASGSRSFVPNPMSFKSKPVVETPKPAVTNEDRHFVGGSGNAVASSSWMANVGEKEDLSKIVPTVAPVVDLAESERQPEDMLKNGLEFMAKAQYKEAVSEFSLVLQREPQNVKALVALGRAYMELNEYAKAQENIEKSINLDPDSAEGYVALADIYARTSDSSAVISTLHKALDRDEYDSALRTRLAFLYACQHRYDVALEQYCLVLEQLPNDFVANFLLSLLLLEQNRLGEALPCAERAVQANSTDIDALGFLSYLYVQTGNVLKAQQLLNMALEDGLMVNADFDTDLATLSILQKRDNQAVVELSEALKLEPGHIEASSKLASLLCHHNQLNEAVKILDQSLKYHPNSLSLHRRLGEVYILGGNMDKALDHFDMLMQLEPRCAEIYNRMNRLSLKKRGEPKSLADYQQDVKSHPLNPAYREELAIAYHEAGQYQQAIAELVKASQLDYTNADYSKSLGLILIELGAYEDAVRQLQTSLSMRPNDGQTRGMLGRALAGQGLNNLAVIEYQKAIESDPDLYIFNLPLARAYSQQGRRDLAVKCLQKFLGVVPENTDNYIWQRAYNGIGDYLLANKQSEAAVEIFMSILHHDPHNDNANHGLAKVWLKRNNYDKASSYIAEAMKSAPLSAELRLTDAAILGAQDKWTSALNTLLEARQTSPHNYKVIEQLGRTYRKCGRFQDAVDTFSQASEDFPDLAGHFEWLKGRVLHRQGQYESAIWSYNHSLEFDPSNWGVYLDMGKAYTSMQQLDEAAQAYRSAERLAPASEQKQIRSLLTRLRR